MPAATPRPTTANRRQRFARKIRESRNFYGNLVLVGLLLWIILNVACNGAPIKWLGFGRPDNGWLEFLAVLFVIGSAGVSMFWLNCCGLLWVYDFRRDTDNEGQVCWSHRIWGAIMLFFVISVTIGWGAAEARNGQFNMGVFLVVLILQTIIALLGFGLSTSFGKPKNGSYYR